MKTSSLIEALLFSRAEPWTLLDLGKALGLASAEVTDALAELETALSDRGLALVQAAGTVTLGTHPDAHVVLDALYKEELSKGLSKASVETLSIIMYGEDVTRGKIDYIRGVNSGFIVRSLLVRGLVERKAYSRDPSRRAGQAGRFMYVPTVALLASLGASHVQALPEYERIHAELGKASAGAELEEINADITTENQTKNSASDRG